MEIVLVHEQHVSQVHSRIKINVNSIVLFTTYLVHIVCKHELSNIPLVWLQQTEWSQETEAVMATQIAVIESSNL